MKLLIDAVLMALLFATIAVFDHRTNKSVAKSYDSPPAMGCDPETEVWDPIKGMCVPKAPGNP